MKRFDTLSGAQRSAAERSGAQRSAAERSGRALLIALFALFLTGPVWAQSTVIFHETFDNCNKDGGNDGKWSGVQTTGTIAADNEGWTPVSGNAASKCARAGTGNALGKLTTPALSGLNGNATLTFRAGAWDSTNESTNLKLSISGGGTLSVEQVTLVKAAFTDYSVTITGGTNSTKITFEGYAEKSSRFFLDEVKVTADGSGGGSSNVCAMPTIEPADGTKFSTPTLTVTITCATEGADIRYTTNGDEPTEQSTLYTEGGFTINGTTTVKAKAFKSEMEAGPTATATYTRIATTGYGSFEHPYTPDDVIAWYAAGGKDQSNVWVRGYIIGSTNDGHSIANTAQESNVLIAASADATEGIPVQLPGGSIRTASNIVDNTDNVGREVSFRGDMTSYFTSCRGLKNTDKVYGLLSIKVSGEEGYATFHSLYPYDMPAGITGSIITASAADGTLTIEEKYTEGESVPANSALLLNAAKGEYPVCINNSIAKKAAGNLLHGGDDVDTDGKTFVAPATDGNTVRYYILSHGKESETYGFFWAAEDGAPVTYRPGYAFLAIESAPGAEVARMFSLDGMPSGITAPAVTGSKTAAVYSLTGVKVGNDASRLPKGIYIINGHKVLIP